MGYACRVERDSMSLDGFRLTSFVITFPRSVLAEVVTHRQNYDTQGERQCSWYERTTTRDISKNSASSRAIPLSVMIQKVFDDPYIPERFSGAGKGMQGNGWLEGEDHERASKQWLSARDWAVSSAVLLLTPADREKLHDTLNGHARHLVGMYLGQDAVFPLELSVHKQDVNRLLEPWLWVTQLVSSTAWDNFFALRCHAAAHPAFARIARMMYLARCRSLPGVLRHGHWHLPFVKMEEQANFTWTPTYRQLADCMAGSELPDLIKFSAARTGWVSYENHDRDSSPQAMLRTFERFIPTDGSPPHGSPCEHAATPAPYRGWDEDHRHLVSNLHGWLQARKLIAHEHCKHYHPPQEEIAGWGIDPDSF